MRLVVLTPAPESTTAPHVALDAPQDPSRYLPEHHWERLELHKATVVPQLLALAATEVDVVVNLCDGAWDEDRAGIEVPRTLERLGLAYTGASARCYDPSREAMKMAAWSAGVAVPAYVLARRADDWAQAHRRLRFPMLVKHPQGYNSVGMTRASRVTTPEALQQQVAESCARFGGALIEEFVEGREFTVLVTEPREAGQEPWALVPVEFCFPAGESFKHFDLKWEGHATMQTRVVDEPELAERLLEAAARTFAALEADGYARFDLRTDRDGVVHLLESNPNPSLFYAEEAFGSGDFILAADALGHRGFLEHQLGLARQRRERQRPLWQLAFDRLAGFGMEATEALAEGVVVLPGEEAPATLVSRQRAQSTWTGTKRSWFDSYAWPLSDEVWVMWSRDPEAWQPINHSCDPNLWLVGLDAVTRRPVEPGEALTLDYATFCGPGMAAFDCRCGAASCRGRVTAEDLRDPALAARYGSHVSAYVSVRLGLAAGSTGRT